MSTRLQLLFVGLIGLCISCNKKAITTALGIEALPSVLKTADFATLQVRGKLDYSHGSREIKDIGVQVRMKKDSVIWVNLSVFGIVGGRVLANRDSVTIISSMGKDYAALDFAELSRRFHVRVDYDLLQAALLGNPLQPIAPSDEVRREKGAIILRQLRDSLAILHYINPVSRRIDSVRIDMPTVGQTLMMRYDNGAPASQGFPAKAEITLRSAADDSLQDRLVVRYSNFELNDPNLKFPFTAPAQHDRRP